MNLPPIPPHDPFSTVDVTSDDGAVVISIETLRGIRRKTTAGLCEHRRVHVDEMEAELTCRDCSAKVNPIAWVLRIYEDWGHVVRMYQRARHEQARLDMRRWVVCRCGERIALSGRPEDEKRRQESREGRFEQALRAISVLTPAAASTYAAGMASKALADERSGGTT